MPKFEILAERTHVTAWTYIVKAEDYETAIDMIERWPDGSHEDVYRRQDDDCYEDSIEYSLLEEKEDKE